MLMKELEGYKVVNTVGEPVGKIKEAYLDLGKWEVVAFSISPGAIKKNVIINLEDVDTMDIEDRTVIVKDRFTADEEPKLPVKDMYPMKKLMDLNVIDADDEKVGRIYDLEVPYEKLKKFKVWKVLIRTGIKERRIRLSPNEIAEVMNEIRLKKAEKEYVEHAE
ncbi:MAG: PRC-barrel domain-containing protein [Candidatus Thermoplasmatota archaeon]|nr:PRC-barrel domain-containing protein [Candidatus Thermoplasmatota archaeon]